MSTGEGGVVLTPLCQGFLKKRKDKMRLRWVTYWFKLHNTTLFFYTKKNGSTLDLRGKYYLFEDLAHCQKYQLVYIIFSFLEVESVQEVMRTENKRYLFELTMKNGKRKVLAADTADLRQEWICQLLKAMNHSSLHTTQLTSDRLWCQESYASISHLDSLSPLFTCQPPLEPHPLDQLKNAMLVILVEHLRQYTEGFASRLRQREGSVPTVYGKFRESFSDHEQRADSNPCSSRSSFSSTSESSSFRRPNSNMSDYLWSSSTSSQTASHHTPQRFSTSQDMTSLGISQHPEDEVEHKMEEIKLESEYDVLPAPKSLNYEEAIYDTPPSNRRASGRNHEMTESIYDVPKSIFMRADGDERPASGGLLIDMMACLGERLSDLGQSS